MTDARSEKQKMLDGDLYIAFTEELTNDRQTAKAICWEINQMHPSKTGERNALVEKLFQQKLDNVRLEPPFYCDYGYNISVGKNFYMNHGCCILDCNLVTFGDDVLFGPGCQVTTATHPTDAEARARGDEYAKPITVGDKCWFGANVTVCPGVTIGDNVVVGAGAVVTKDLPSNTVCTGVPAKVIKHITTEQ
ncbi:hypothetical protein SARC_12150 [Sphaeroforma arctica JP610]|uniref:Maltose/galactoside acetyltransferase domain-containing protein n=1 Tax=Sphaeroforma arctica JP610 TaxID=667725 RepID=A0A0L0FEW9_9EUKA|nr:hypothetical protein SARC_12150 [Sphaeroforma arctica JP610]KNC75324.1 hypothetical protein SARC_12150 [Sphaeroforma arctica JP610]|eukprot:XP_014149226.1 hypothetical protein SARC_12150 [Sphaeroforma arctica JP610]